MAELTDQPTATTPPEPATPSEPSTPSEPAATEPSRVTEIGALERVDRDRHPWATGLGILALVLVVTLGVVGLGELIGDDQPRREVDQVVLPRLAGRTVVDAQVELERLGLLVDLRYEANERIPPDIVVEHEPIAGARLEVGEQVVLVVSDGPAGVTVPDLSGVSAPEAVRTLSVIGLVGVVVEVHDERVPQAEVVATLPAAGARAVAGTEVQVQVSIGPEPRVVPDVVGQPATDAFAAIGRGDLQIGGVTRRYERDAQPGTVLSTAPAPGESVPRDTPIRVVVAAAEPLTTVPDLVGLTRRSAEQLAAEVGIAVSVRLETLDPGDGRNGLVISQTPVAYGPAEGSMSIVVGSGAAPPPPTTTTTPPTTTTTTP